MASTTGPEKAGVPFANFAGAVAAIRPEIDAAIARVLESGWLILGEEVRFFEEEFARFTGARHAVGTASGTDAIELALRALGIGPGDEVVTQANTCVPTVAAIERAGATPVLCDVQEEAGTMDPESLRAAIGPLARAVIPVHLYGQCAEMDDILAVAAERELPIVEDCAQAHGANYKGKAAGTIGRVGCFSFYPTKNLGALGDGGAVITSDAQLAERLRLLRQYGQVDRYRHELPGVNSRLDELQAAILRAKLKHLDRWNERRSDIAAEYTLALQHTPVRPLARLPHRNHAHHLYVVRAGAARDGLQQHLRDSGVATLVHYPLPIHRQTAYRKLATDRVSLTRSEHLCSSVLSLPIYPELTDDEVEFVGAAAREAALTTAGDQSVAAT